MTEGAISTQRRLKGGGSQDWLTPQTRGPWIAFRYDSTGVLFYAGQAKDTIGFTASELRSKQLPQPLARWAEAGI